MSENPLHRIKAYLDFKGITVSAFEKSLNFSNGSFASQLKNNKSIGSDKLENILNLYVDLNANWVFSGQGEMLKKSIKETTQKNTSIELKTNEIDLFKELVLSQKKTIKTLEEKIELQKETVLSYKNKLISKKDLMQMTWLTKPIEENKETIENLKDTK